MYRIQFRGTIITKPLSLERAKAKKRALLKTYFTECSENDLVIIDENGNNVFPVVVNDNIISYKK